MWLVPDHGLITTEKSPVVGASYKYFSKKPAALWTAWLTDVNTFLGSFLKNYTPILRTLTYISTNTKDAPSTIFFMLHYSSSYHKEEFNPKNDAVLLIFPCPNILANIPPWISRRVQFTDANLRKANEYWFVMDSYA